MQASCSAAFRFNLNVLLFNSWHLQPDPSTPPCSRRTRLSCTDNTVLTTAASTMPRNAIRAVVWCDRANTVVCQCSKHLQGRPVHRCAAPPFWPSCCWSPGRSEPYACRRQQLPRPVRLLLDPLLARSHRSQRPKVWSPQATYSFDAKVKTKGWGSWGSNH